MYIDIYGFHDREVTKVEWNSSTFYVYYYHGKTERRINIIDECRDYFKNQGTRFTRDIKKQLEALTPKTLCIGTHLEPYYQQYCHNNIGGYRVVADVDEDDLINNWLSKVIL